MTLEISPYKAAHLQALLALTERAWEPVFPKMKDAIPGYVYEAFYPDGWKTRQLADVEAMCRDGETALWVAMSGDQMSGYIGLRTHREDRMGEVYILAVDPALQRQGIGAALLQFAFDQFRQAKLDMVMVETGGDEGHAPSRAAYEDAGFERYPVARYFRKL